MGAGQEDVHIDGNPVWSPAGGHLYFVSDRAGPWNIWRIAIDETSGARLGEAHPVTSATSGLPSGLSLSGDGRQLVYSTWEIVRTVRSIDFAPDVEESKGDAVRVLPVSLGARNTDTSPDGQWIAFDAPFGNPDARSLGIARPDGSDLRQLTETDHRDRYPRWSPDGSRLAFRSNRSGSLETWVVNADGSGLRQVSHTPKGSVSIGAWSPDGRRFANFFYEGEVTFVFDVDGTWDEASRSALPSLLNEGEHRQLEFHPMSWSPDGNRIAGLLIASDGATVNAIAVYSLETRTYRVFDDVSGWPTWLSDGRRLLFANWRPSISLLDTETGEHHAVYSIESSSADSSDIDGLLAIAPEDQTIFFTRNDRAADIWMLTLGEQE